MGWLGRGLPAWCADDLLEKLVLNAIGSLCRGRRVAAGYFMDAVLLLSLHTWVGGHAMELVIGGKRNRLQMGPETTALAGWFKIDGLRRRTLSVQDARGRLDRSEIGGAIDVVDQIEKAQGLLFWLDIPMMVGWGMQVRYHGGGNGLMITVCPPITSANLISWAASVGRLRGTVCPLLQLHHAPAHKDRIHHETRNEKRKGPNFDHRWMQSTANRISYQLCIFILCSRKKTRTFSSPSLSLTHAAKSLQGPCTAVPYLS